MLWVTLLLFLLGTFVYVQADCYPGDSNYTTIVQEIYHDVTSDDIVFNSRKEGSTVDSLTRRQLCSNLANLHNHGSNPGQSQPNSDFLGHVTVSQPVCTNALTYTQGYETIAEWQRWAGYHSGKWYTESQVLNDDSEWFSPSFESEGMYSLQPLRFDSQDRINRCVTEDSIGSTCRYGWNKSGKGVCMVSIGIVHMLIS